MAASLGGPLFLERSVKIVQGKLSNDRFLLIFPKYILAQSSKDRLKQICIDLGAPLENLTKLLTLLPLANGIALGYEPEGNNIRFKCYLEFLPHRAPKKNLTFIALKWVSGDTKAPSVFTRYWSHTGRSHAKKQASIISILPKCSERDALFNSCNLAVKKGFSPFLLEIEEAGNPRHSIDIKTAGLGYKIKDLKGNFCPSFLSFLKTHGEDELCHVAAGIGRNGQPFMTIYYDSISIILIINHINHPQYKLLITHWVGECSQNL